jgi:hypothetical protein
MFVLPPICSHLETDYDRLHDVVNDPHTCAEGRADAATTLGRWPFVSVKKL